MSFMFSNIHLSYIIIDDNNYYWYFSFELCSCILKKNSQFFVRYLENLVVANTKNINKGFDTFNDVILLYKLVQIEKESTTLVNIWNDVF